MRRQHIVDLSCITLALQIVYPLYYFSMVILRPPRNSLTMQNRLKLFVQYSFPRKSKVLKQEIHSFINP